MADLAAIMARRRKMEEEAGEEGALRSSIWRSPSSSAAAFRTPLSQTGSTVGAARATAWEQSWRTCSTVHILGTAGGS